MDLTKCCCPACAGPLVLFNEKFGEVNGPQEKDRRASSTSGPSGKGSPDGTSITEVPAEERQGPAGPHGQQGPGSLGPAGPVGPAGLQGPQGPTKLHGGWYCSDCGVHIIPENSEVRRKDTKQPSLRHSSRSMEDLKVNTQMGAKKRSSSQPASPKSKALDDQYEALEKQLRDSFMTLIGHIREHYSQKEDQLKEYQVDLCQREKILRANEEHLNQRINRLRQSEDVVRRKMERLTLYKSSMLSQLEAKSLQMGRWERSLQQWEAKLKGHGILEKPAPDVGPHGFRETTREAQREAQREVHRLSPDPRLSQSGVHRETTREAIRTSVAREEQRPWHSRPPSGSSLNVSQTEPQTPKPHPQQEALLNRQQSPVIYDYPTNIQPKSPNSPPHNTTHPTSPRQQPPLPPRDAYYHPVQHQQHPHQQQNQPHHDYRAQGLPYHNAQPHRAQRHSAPPGSHRSPGRSPGRPNESLNKSYGQNESHNKSYGKDDSANASDLTMTNYLYNSFNGSAKPSPDSGYTSVNHGYPSGAGPPAYRPVSSHHRPTRLQYQSSQVSLADAAASDHESVHATSPRLSSSYHVLDHSVELEEITDSQGRRVYRRVTEI